MVASRNFERCRRLNNLGEQAMIEHIGRLRDNTTSTCIQNQIIAIALPLTLLPGYFHTILYDSTARVLDNASERMQTLNNFLNQYRIRKIPYGPIYLMSYELSQPAWNA